MNFKDARDLINLPGIQANDPQIWADLGCGEGLFTNALADIVGYGSKIYAVDRNIGVFKANRHDGVVFEKVQADFVSDSLDLPNLDGILMANSFHFVSHKIEFINKLRMYFEWHESFLIVEYDTDESNPWVPYPMSFNSMRKFFLSLGFDVVEKIRELPSRYNKANIYSASIRRSHS